MFGLWVVNMIYPDGLWFDGRFLSYLQAGMIMTIGLYVLKPLVDLIMIPLNVLFMGAFKWVTTLIVFFVTDYLTAGMRIQAFMIPSVDVFGYTTLQVDLNMFMAYFWIAFMFSLVIAYTKWLFDED